MSYVDEYGVDPSGFAPMMQLNLSLQYTYKKQGFKDLASEGEGSRFKTWTDGESGSVILGVENLKQEDEGSYKCILNNGGEDVEHEFNIYVTGE